MSNGIKEKSEDGSVEYFIEKYIDHYAMYKNREQFRKGFWNRNKTKALIAIIVGIIVFIILDKYNIFFPHISCIICEGLLIYSFVICIIWYLHQKTVLRKWPEHMDYKNDKYWCNIWRTTLIWIFIKPVSFLVKCLRCIANISGTRNIAKYSFETLSSGLISIGCVTIFLPGIFRVVNLVIVRFFIDFLSSNTTDHVVACFCYDMVIGLYIYTIVRKCLLKHFLKIRNDLPELGANGRDVLYKSIVYEMQTIDLWLILFLTVLLTPVKFKREEFTCCAEAMKYLCITASAYITLKGHLNSN